ncbi:NAD dependent epimerase/dehydratase family protein [Aureimonas altamirensis DSM 21988]|uniref:UDP-glucose 4-epimerase n=2 Tax=Aureimonas altamirensis TaxID=370622 RepID=A0A0P0YVP1_9HYPH|nr:NAD(P)-dependent oxidoreductase [Aureimonas altamirensis]BAT25482.1 UDP-glucose 4-epimerase [Aureimonas altamirensis]SHK02224.1 NAD dependent epimerase/dehydratase family protein [Aureimonas altamirensis DSM 21988]
MHCLVTGHKGFLGRRLSAALIDFGHSVTGLDTPAGQPIDLRDAPAITDCIMAARPEVIFHLGGVSGPMLLNDAPGQVLAINGHGTLNVIEAAGRAGVRRLIFASSVAAHQRVGGRPGSLYAVSKTLGEQLVAWAGSTMETTSIRIGSVFGPGRATANPLHQMIAEGLATGVVPYPAGNMEPSIEVGDCARLFAGLADAARMAPHYDAVRYCVSYRAAAETISAAVGAQAHPTALEESFLYDTTFDVEPLARDSGSGPPPSFSDAIGQLVQTVREAA